MTHAVDVVVGHMPAALSACLDASIEAFRALGVVHECPVALIIGMLTHVEARATLAHSPPRVVVVPAWGRPTPRGAVTLLSRADVVCALDARQINDLPLPWATPRIVVSGVPEPQRSPGKSVASRFATEVGWASTTDPADGDDGVALIGGDGIDDLARVRCALSAGVVPILDRRSPYARGFVACGALVPSEALEAIELATALARLEPVRCAVVERLRRAALRRDGVRPAEVIAAWIESVELAGSGDLAVGCARASGTLAAT